MNTVAYCLLAHEIDLAQLPTASGTARISRISLDTEFYRQDSYYPEPCLIQLKIDTQTFLVDATSLSSSAISQAINPLLQHTDNVLLHAGRQDLELLTQLGVDLQPEQVRDTQVAHAFLTGDLQLSYAALVSEYLDTAVDKQETMSDWRRRPLSASQCTYAALDVAYLDDVWHKQQQALRESGWLACYEEECQRLYQIDTAREPAIEFRRLKNRHLLQSTQLRYAFVLYFWRESLCKQYNLTRNRLIRDEQLVQHVSRQESQLPEKLGRIKYPSFIEQEAAEAAYQQALTLAEPYTREQLDYQPLDTQQKTRLRQLQQQVKKIADQKNISASLLAPRKELELLVRKQTSDLIRSGWRAPLLSSLL